MLLKFLGKETLTLATSDSKERKYAKYGYAEFEVNNTSVRVLLLESEEERTDELILIFSDATSAEETYGAGRYLEITQPVNGKILIDFNYAYNPYCAYNAKYSCPFPPQENQLSVAIRAGEKNYIEN